MAASPANQSLHRARTRGDGLHDVVVAGAAAEIAVQLFTDGLVVELVALAFDHVDCGHDHAGRAIAALQSVMLAEGFLHRMQGRAVRNAFYRRDARAFGLPGEHGAGLARMAVDMDDAGAALRGVAADMRAG